MSTGRPALSMATRAALWRARVGRPRARTIVWQPQPPWPGSHAAARRLAAGVLLLDGALAEAPGRSPWEVEPPNAGWEAALHGHGWLDHYGATDDRAVRERLRDWVFDWIGRYGDGRGPGWAPELMARRIMRWIGHAPQLLAGVDADRSEAFFAALGLQANRLASVWTRTGAGIARIEALAGLVYAGLSLEGYERLADRTVEAMAAALDRLVDAEGAIPSRNPEELAGIVELAVWTAGTISESGRELDRRVPSAIARMAPVLKALRHPDGTLARFHGARQVAPERLDAILGGAAVVTAAPGGGAMGYRRVAAEGLALLIDAAPRPPGGHDGALAFEIAIDGAPVVVNAGSGAGFGPEAAAWAASAAAHSGIDFGAEAAPAPVRASLTGDDSGQWCLAESEGPRAALGLSHERRLFLAADGARLAGEETAVARSAADRDRFAALHPGTESRVMVARFILHPSVRAETALAGKAAVLTLPGGAKWMLRQFGGALSLGASRYFDPGHLAPRPTREIAVSAPVAENWGRVTWSLERLDRGAIPPAPQAALFEGAPGDGAGGR